MRTIRNRLPFGLLLGLALSGLGWCAAIFLINDHTAIWKLLGSLSTLFFIVALSLYTRRAMIDQSGPRDRQ